MAVAAILVMWSRCHEQTFVILPKEAPHKIWLSLAKRFLRRCLSIVDDDDDANDGWTDARAWVYYRLTYEPAI